MNVKPVHLKKDSNPSRQKKNEIEKQSMKQQFTSTNLLNVPQHFFLRNETVYTALVNNLEMLGLSMHLKDVDVYSLVSIANTIDLLAEVERDLKQHGTAQLITTREGYDKIVASPYIQMRATNLNLLQSQFKQLQLDPASRQLLTESVLNDVNMMNNDIDEDDDMLNSILERLN